MCEELMVRFCAPTLAGMKTGSLFSCIYREKTELHAELQRLNGWMKDRGLLALPLRYQDGRALIYVYRPQQLAGDLAQPQAVKLLTDRGYSVGNCSRCVAQLVEKLQGEAEFPHEVGLFLGYPPEDVDGFIHQKAGCKCVGCWKVYGDEAAAQEKFRSYHRCTQAYCALAQQGVGLQQLAVAS